MINTITPKVVDGEMRLFLTVLSGQVLQRGGERFVFDAESFQLPAKTLLDYNHDNGEIIGYCRDFSAENTTGAVYCEAVLVARPDDPSARVNEIITNIEHGAPYEVSPLIDLSESTPVDRLDGARSYHNAILRGVAICPHGTDADTAFVAFSQKSINSIPQQGEFNMDEELKNACREPLARFHSEIATNGSGEAGNGQNTKPKEKQKEPRNPELSQMIEEFGRDRGLDFYLAGHTIEEARAKDYAELKALRAEEEEKAPETPDAQEASTEIEPDAEQDAPKEDDEKIKKLNAKVDLMEQKLVALSALVKRGAPESVAPSVDVDDVKRQKIDNPLLAAAKRYAAMGTKRIS